ncbi:MAG: HU family DNA-binding protein [Proteobacteria bacterium]|nr:HU family DNA-binding protein [Pseudomonadota bacterium]MDA1356447.1 HU family DNA-binding protein [Pseudomonadota bacterium]
MNQGELIEAVVKSSGMTKSDASKAVKTALDEMGKALKKGTSVRTTLGTFSVYKRGARKGRNPATGEAIKISASKGVRFKASKTLKDRVNKR